MVGMTVDPMEAECERLKESLDEHRRQLEGVRDMLEIFADHEVVTRTVGLQVGMRALAGDISEFLRTH